MPIRELLASRHINKIEEEKKIMIRQMTQQERENFFAGFAPKPQPTLSTEEDGIVYSGPTMDASEIYVCDITGLSLSLSPKKIRTRGFEIVVDEHRKHPKVDIQLPTRGTATSAGYDVYLPCDLELQPYEHKMIMSDVKAYMQEGEVLMAFPRSSLGFKKGLVLRNTVGIIDADYYNNPSNDGNIGLALHNHSDEIITLKAGERVGQFIFMPFLVADNGNTDTERTGGFGSTGTK